jgi:GNAT superfamily N-acetyltransferase
VKAVETVETKIEVVERIDDRLREEMLDCWVEASNAGGGVGFVGQVTPEIVAPKLDQSIAAAHDGKRLLVVLRAGDRLAGFGYLAWNDLVLQSHWATVLALMVHPAQQGKGLGRVLLDGIADVARERGLEFLTLDYREGLGLGEFYAKLGFVEVGRLPNCIRVAPGDDRDGVSMMRRLV